MFNRRISRQNGAGATLSIDSFSLDRAAAIAAGNARLQRRRRMAAGALICFARRRLPQDAYQAWLIAAFATRRRRRAFAKK